MAAPPSRAQGCVSPGAQPPRPPEQWRPRRSSWDRSARHPEAWNASWYFCWQIYVYIYTVWEIKKMGNLWEIYSFHQTWPGNFGHFPCPRLPKPQIWWSLWIWQLGSSHLQTCPYDEQWCVCVSRNCMDTSKWLFEFGKMWCWSFELVQTIKL